MLSDRARQQWSGFEAEVPLVERDELVSRLEFGLALLAVHDAIVQNDEGAYQDFADLGGIDN